MNHIYASAQMSWIFTSLHASCIHFSRNPAAAIMKVAFGYSISGAQDPFIHPGRRSAETAARGCM
ncbi:hypothetical protein B0H10DRAFT_2023097 [Mycena sp. CBHHK59/15]|nr:hypothetical protein B0H10DRAFT_2023097 [Mycena sp. CBHHK59/15]